MDASNIETLVKNLLSLLDAEIESVTVSGTHRTVVAIHVRDGERLIGPNGEHLRALNTIARRLAESQWGEEAASFLVDINGYHEAQMEKVRQEARMLAQRARLFKHDVEMSPMSAYERLVVHELFADDPEIETTSQGEGKFRHIVLKYRNANSSLV